MMKIAKEKLKRTGQRIHEMTDKREKKSWTKKNAKEEEMSDLTNNQIYERKRERREKKWLTIACRLWSRSKALRANSG